MKNNKSITLKSTAGFSLVELMVVVSIIGILAAVAIPNFSAMQARARQSGARSVLSGLYMGEKIFVSDWGTYVTDFRNLSFCPEGANDYNFGFLAAGPAIPAGYVGPGVAATLASVQFNATAAIAGCPAITLTARADAAGNLLGAAVVGPPSTFTADARGNIDGDAVIDSWTINQANVLANNASDL